MKKKLVDILYYITITVVVLVIIIWFVLSIVNGGIELNTFFDAIRILLILPGILISPLMIFLAVGNRIFFDKTNSLNLYRTIIINIIMMILALTAPDPFSGLMMI